MITIASTIRDRLMNAGFAAPDRSTWIDGWAQPAFFDYPDPLGARARLRGKLNLPSSATLLLCVGMLRPDKGQHHLLGAVRILRDHGAPVVCLLAGEATAESSAYAAELRSIHNQRTSPDWLRETYPSIDPFIDVCAKEWQIDLTLAAAFADSRPGRLLTLRYEDLLQRPEEELAKVLGFLGVDTSPERLAGCCAGSSFQALSKGRSLGVEDRESFFRKGVAGDWRNHLTPAQAALFEERAGDWLDRFGYRR